MPRPKPRSARPLTTVEKVDIAVARRVALDRRRRAGKAVARFAELGDQPPLALMSGAVAALGVARRDERLFRTGLRMLAAHSLTTLVKLVGKNAIDRTRPADALRNGHYRLHEGDSRKGRLRSMPSGHSAGVTAVAVAATRDFPQLTLPAVVAGGAVMAAQLPAKNHFLSDVLVGAAIGSLAAGISLALIPRLERIRPERSQLP